MLLDRRADQEAPFHGWTLVIALGITTIFSYGSTQYLFGVLVTPVSDEMHWSRASVSAAYAIAVLVSGAVALPVGRIIDSRGARGVLSLGSMLAGVSLVAMAGVRELWQFYLVWALAGCAMALTFYTVTLVVVNQWFSKKRGTAFAIITTLGGLASVIFVPLAGVLEAHYDWRTAVVVIGLLQFVVPLPMHALLVRRRPEDLGQVIDGAPVRASSQIDISRADSEDLSLRQSLQTGAFWTLAAASGLMYLGVSVVQAHVISYLIGVGYAPTNAALVSGLVGLSSLPGRLILNLLSNRISSRLMLVSSLALLACGVVILLVNQSPVALALFILVYGAPFGAVSPMRASVLADQFGRKAYGAILAAQGITVSVCSALGPLMAGWLYDVLGSYQLALGLTASIFLAAALCVGFTPKRKPLIEAQLA